MIVLLSTFSLASLATTTTFDAREPPYLAVQGSRPTMVCVPLLTARSPNQRYVNMRSCTAEDTLIEKIIDAHALQGFLAAYIVDPLHKNDSHCERRPPTTTLLKPHSHTHEAALVAPVSKHR